MNGLTKEKEDLQKQLDDLQKQLDEVRCAIFLLFSNLFISNPLSRFTQSLNFVSRSLETPLKAHND